MKVLSGFYYVEEDDSQQIFQTRARGNFRKKGQIPLVGDEVAFQAENEREGLVMAIEGRKNILHRPPVSNVDLAIIVVSVEDPKIPQKLIDRLLVSVESHKIQPLIYFTKLDILPASRKLEFQSLREMYCEIGYSCLDNLALKENLDQLKPYFQGKTVVTLGQSGVGKTTFLNNLLPGLNKETGEISKALGRGRHTTRHVELHKVFSGLLADTPGFSSISFDHIEGEDLSEYFPEMKSRKVDCKFRECSHTHEPGCAIKEALELGQITKSRYESYLDFYQEIMNRKPNYSKNIRRK